MPLTKSSKIILRFSMAIFMAVVVIGYSLFSARHIIKGPTIDVISPQNGEMTKSNFVEIKGKSENLNYISLNDRQIFIDDNGNFKEKLLLYSGENTIKIYGKDKFGREKTEYLRIIAPEGSADTFARAKPEATSTATTTPHLSEKSSQVTNF